MSSEAEEFICPECGAREAGAVTHVSAIPDDRFPWTSVLKRIRCASCGLVIPAHLGERWDGMTLEQAQEEWRVTYRDAER